MSKRPRTKKKPRSKVASAADSDNPRRKVRMSLEALEVTRGHDGLLRGKPEAALLVAAYRTNGVLPASLLARLLVRVQPTADMPCSVSLAERELRYDARFAPTERIAVLVFAIEEDSGHGVEALYARLERPGELLLYNAAEPIPSLLPLDEWAQREHRAPTAHPVEILFDGVTLENLTGSDQFISASAFSVAIRTHADEPWRLPFVARDARNDWTLLLRMRIGI